MQKFSCTKFFHKQIAFRSLKKNTAEAYKEALSNVYSSNYENFSYVNKAYENFIQKLMSIIDKSAPFKTKWFDGEVLEIIPLRDKVDLM